MDNLEQRIQTVEIILRGSRDPEQRALALDDLRRVAEEASRSGRSEARLAIDLLNQYADPSPQNRDRELAEYEQRWAALQGLTDPKLFDLLGELKEKPQIAARLRPAVIKSLRAWMAKSIVTINDFNEREVQVLNKFIDVISGIDIYNVELEDLRELRNALFRLRYAEVSLRIYDALRAWDDGEAWHQLELLESPPSSFAEDVGALQEKIYGVCNTKEKVEALLEQSPVNEPTSWADVGVLVKYSQEASRSLNEHDIPEHWKRQLQRRIESAIDSALQYLEKRAAAAGTSTDVRTFWTEYGNLQLTEVHAKLKPQEHWFQNFLKHISDRIIREVQTALSPQMLDDITSRLRIEKADLPDSVRDAVESLLNYTGQIAAVWTSMRAGDDFAIPVSAQLPIPEEFERDAATFGERLAKVKEAFAKLNASAELSLEQTSLEVLDVARSVLDEQPGHLLATALKAEAEQKIAILSVESALSDWDFEKLMELSRGRKGKGDFGYYLEHEEDLRLWLEPRVKTEKFSSWEDAQRWWANWKTTNAQLPKRLPNDLAKAMRSEEEKRMAEWVEVLGELINKDLSEEECKSVAQSLKDGPENLNLQGFQDRFLRKAEFGRAYDLIKKRDWDAAQQIIDSLDENPPDIRPLNRLKIRLEVERARQQGVEMLAEVLKREWGTVKSYFNDPLALLLKAIEDAWKQESEGAIKKLRDVVRRVLVREQKLDPQLEEIRKWEDWFTVERAIKDEESATSLSKLVAYIKESGQPEEILHKRLERLVEHWLKGPENLVMLAWADRMFEWLTLGNDPQELLKTESDELAQGVITTLKSPADLDLQLLNDMQQDLNAKDAAWRNLNEYLNLVPRHLTRPRPPRDFERAKVMLRNLIAVRTMLDELDKADLRHDANEEKIETCRAILMRELSEIGTRENLLKRVARLEPLSKLDAIEKNIKDAALHCRSKKDLDVYEPGAFASLASRLREMIERFKRAELVNGQMWRIVSKEYCEMVYTVACIYAPQPHLQDLKRLAERMDELDLKERGFRDGMERIWESKPSFGAGSVFDPEEHGDFLRSFPPTPPLSQRDYLFFKYRYADVQPLKSIILQSRDKLPEWIRTYLDEGIPSCADET